MTQPLAEEDILLFQTYAETAKRAKGSDILPKVILGAHSAESLLLYMSNAIEALVAALKSADAESEYFVYADYGYETEECLYKGSKAGAMTAFFRHKSEVSDEGYRVLEVARLANSGEYITEITESI